MVWIFGQKCVSRYGKNVGGTAWHLRRTLKHCVTVLLGSVVLVSISSAEEIKGSIANGESLIGTCGACHGPAAEAIANYPTLDGQHANYLFIQMQKIRAEKREAPLMVGQLTNMTDQQLKDIAVYYANLPSRLGAAEPELVAHGEALYKYGDIDRGIVACSACHGVGGEGVKGAGFPKLAGQKTAYVTKVLNRYRAQDNEKIDDSYTKMMGQIARPLHDDDIEALSSYVDGLRTREGR